MQSIRLSLIVLAQITNINNYISDWDMADGNSSSSTNSELGDSISSKHPTVTDISTFTFSSDVSINTNLPALISIFTPAATNCSGRWLLPFHGGTTVWSTSISAASPDYFWNRCQPFGAQSTYSPGVCIDGQTLAFISAIVYSSSGTTRTRYGGRCCPSGSSIYAHACTEAFENALSVVAPVTWTTSELGSGASASDIVTSTEYFPTVSVPALGVNSTTLTRGEKWSYALIVLWEVKDLSLLPSAYATEVARLIGVSFTPTSSPASPASLSSIAPETGTSNPSTTPSRGLSTGAKAGIGTGAAIGALLLISLIAGILLTRRRRQRKRQSPTTVQDHDDAVPEMEDQDQELGSRKWFLGGRWRSEVEERRVPGELDARGVLGAELVELDAEGSGQRR